ncbi:hypothetical protein [Acetobacter tropicalis]|nr:hypothetical protein [Acetobacter tropicalis]
MRKLAIVLGVLFSSSAFAQSSGIPWANGRVLTAPMMQQFDAAKLNVQSLGKPGFAPKLNSIGQITDPINTMDIKSVRSLAFGQDNNGNPIGYFGPLADTATSPYFFQIGGINRFAPGGMKITSQLYGGPENCLLNIQNTYFQQFARCGAGYDQSIAEMVKTTVNAPMAEFGASVNSPSGGVYNVQYTGTSVKIRPGLSAADTKYFLYRTRIYTNVSNGVRDNDTNTPSIWFGYAGAPVAGTDDSGTYTEIPISSDASVWSAGWMRVNSSFAKVTTTTAPGSNSGDATDTVLTNYSAPVILVGTSGTAFNTNRYVNIDLTAKDTQSRTYQDIETDYAIKDTADHAHDYQYKISGHTDSVVGSVTYPSPKSFIRKIDGHGIMPILEQIQGAAYGGRTIHTDSGFQLYRQGDLNTGNVGDKQQYIQLVGANLAGAFNNLLLFGSFDNADTSIDGWGRGSLHLASQICNMASSQTEGTTPGQSGCAGAGQIVWGAQGNRYGVSLGAGLGSSVTYAMHAKSDGTAEFLHRTQFDGQILPQQATISTLPAGVQDGASVWCLDCVLNGVTGVMAYYHGSPDGHWRDPANNLLTK